MVIECCECNLEFNQGDKIYVCDNCDEPVCGDCKEEEHNCIESDTESNIVCEGCGDCSEEMHQCDKCSDYFCKNCIDEHLEEEKEGIKFEEYDFGKYAKEKIADNL